MTVLEKFVAFAEALPSDQRGSIEEAMAAIMATHSGAHGFYEAELGELDRRVAEPKPEYSSPDIVAKLLGKPFSA